MKAPYTDEQFEQQLKASNRTLDDVKHDVRRSLTIDKLLNKEIKSKITVSDADVTDYYDNHKAEFDVVEPTYRLAVIRVTSVPRPSPAICKAARPPPTPRPRRRFRRSRTASTPAKTSAPSPPTSPKIPTPRRAAAIWATSESQFASDPTVGAALLKLKPGRSPTSSRCSMSRPRSQSATPSTSCWTSEPAGQREISDPVVQQHIRQLLRDSRSQLIQNAYFEMLRDQAKVENFFAEQIFKNDAK